MPGKNSCEVPENRISGSNEPSPGPSNLQITVPVFQQDDVIVSVEEDSMHTFHFPSQVTPLATSSSTETLPVSSDFWDILFSFRHSITSNALAVSIFMDVLNILQVKRFFPHPNFRKLILVITVLFISCNDECDIPLRGFLYFYASRLGFSLIFAIFFYINQKIKLAGPIFLRSLDFLRLGVDILTITIVVCGNYLVFVRNECQFTSPSMFYTSFGLIVVNYLTIAFPIFLLITLLISGRFGPPSTISQIEGGVPPEALEKTKLVRVRHLGTFNAKPSEIETDQPKPEEKSFSPKQSGPNSPATSIYTTISTNGTSVLVVPEECRNQECSICLCQLEENELVRRLACRHHFHSECIDRWLQDHRTCPLCKYDIASHLDQPRPSRRQSYLPADAFLSLSPRIN